MHHITAASELGLHPRCDKTNRTQIAVTGVTGVRGGTPRSKPLRRLMHHISPALSLRRQHIVPLKSLKQTVPFSRCKGDGYGGKPPIYTCLLCDARYLTRTYLAPPKATHIPSCAAAAVSSCPERWPPPRLLCRKIMSVANHRDMLRSCIMNHICRAPTRTYPHLPHPMAVRPPSSPKNAATAFKHAPHPRPAKLGASSPSHQPYLMRTYPSPTSFLDPATVAHDPW